MLSHSSLQRKHLLFVTAELLLGFSMWGTLLAVAPALTLMGQELGLVYSEMGLVFSLPVLMLAIFAFPGGLLTDRIGPRKTGMIGALLIGFGGLLRGTSTNLTSLLLFSSVFGIGWGLGLPTLPKIVGGWFDSKVAGTFTGIYTIGIYVGAGIATAVTFFGSWREATITWGILSIFVALLWLALIRDPPKTLTEGRGSLRNVVKNKSIWLLTAMFFLGANVPFYTLTGWLPTILAVQMRSASAAFVASLLSFFAAGATLAVPILSDKIGRRKPFLWIPALTGALASYLVFSGSVSLVAVAVAILGVSISAIFVISFVLPIELVSRDMVGSATGLMLLAYAGGVAGPWLAGFTRDLTSSFAPTMITLILSFVITGGLSFLLPETGKRGKS